MNESNSVTSKFTECFKGNNGPAFIGIIGIVVIVLGRYGYKFKAVTNGSELSLESSFQPHPVLVDEIIESSIADNTSYKTQ